MKILRIARMAPLWADGSFAERHFLGAAAGEASVQFCVCHIGNELSAVGARKTEL
jgi:hypothetical protein